MLKKVVFALVCLGLLLTGNTPVFSQTARPVRKLTIRQVIIEHAQRGDVQSLLRMKAQGYNIDTTNANGDTALCEATWSGDQYAVATLIRAGANQNSPCMQSIPESYKQDAGIKETGSKKLLKVDLDTVATNGSPAVAGTAATGTGLSTGAMVGIGVGAAALVGGGVALASNSGGSSKDSKGSATSCGKHAMLSNGYCICRPGYTGDTCDDCAEGYGHFPESDTDISTCYKKLQCVHSDVGQVGNTCVCNEGYDPGDNCQSCIIGYDYHGTSQCHKTKECPNGIQYGDNCVCRLSSQYSDAIREDICQCNEPAFKQKDGTLICIPNPACIGYTEGSDEIDTSKGCEARTTSCLHGPEELYQCSTCKDGYVFDEKHGCIENTACTGTTTLVNCGSGAEDYSSCKRGEQTLYTCLSCKEGYVFDENGSCVENAGCTGVTSLTNCAEGSDSYVSCLRGEQTLYTCTRCKEGFNEEDNCQTCIAGYELSGDNCERKCYGATSASTLMHCLEVASCTLGSDTRYYCTECEGGYVLTADGQCVTKGGVQYLWYGKYNNKTLDSGIVETDRELSGLYFTSGDIVGGAYADGPNATSEITLTKTVTEGEKPAGTEETIGIYSKDAGAKGAYLKSTEGDSGTATNTITITTVSNGNVCGIQSKTTNHGARSAAEGTAKNTIIITNKGSGNVYGLLSLNGDVDGALSSKGTASNIIQISNENVDADIKSSVYGMFANASSAYGARTKESTIHAKANNIIKINDTGYGDVYGISAEGKLWGSLVNMNTASTNATTTVTNTIYIKKNGKGDVYGLKATDEIHGARNFWRTPNNSSVNNITVERYNSGGNIYGIQGAYNANIYAARTGERTHSVATNNIIIKNKNKENLSEVPPEIDQSIYGISETSAGSGKCYAALGNVGTAQNTIKIENYKTDGTITPDFDTPFDALIYGITTKTNTSIYGIGNVTTVNSAVSSGTNGIATNEITIDNWDKGTIYGIDASTILGASSGNYTGGKAITTIDIYNFDKNTTSYGIRGKSITTSAHNLKDRGENEKTDINIVNVGEVIIDENDVVTAGDASDVYGIYALASGSVTIQDSDSVNITSVGAKNDTKSTGVYISQNSSLTNSGNITLTHDNYKEKRDSAIGNGMYFWENFKTGIATGVYVVGGNTTDTSKNVINAGNITLSGFDTGYGINIVNGTKVNTKNTGSITLTANETISEEGPLSWGIYADSAGKSSSVITNEGTITISGGKEAFGIKHTGTNGSTTNSGEIRVSNTTSSSYGMAGGDSKATLSNSGTIIVSSEGEALGIRGYGAAITNTGTIQVSSDVDAVAIYAAAGSNVENKKNIIVSGEGRAFGIYHKGDGGVITNSGTIDVTAPDAYGIYVEYTGGKATTVKNTKNGVIKLNGAECTGACTGNVSNGRYIVLNGGELWNASLISAQSLDITSLDGTLVAAKGAQFDIENAFSGDLEISADLTTEGFNTTYIAENMINAGDTSSLNLISQSALFDASLQNDTDVVMTMKSFDNVIGNKSLAAFLEKNYALGNNEEFFNNLKEIGNASAFTSAISNLTAADTISRFAHEDLTVMREVNLQMNEKMFANNSKQIYETQGSVNGFSFKNDNHSSATYALGTKRIAPRWSVGYAMSNTNLYTDDDKNTTRRGSLFSVFAPIGYENRGVQMISTPQVAFQRFHYTRKGYNNTSYNGIIEKRVIALMNEARYPMNVKGLTLIPTVEFNAIAYNQKGNESDKPYALTMPSDNRLSVEAGVGLKASKTLNGINLKAGLMLYKEFADPYSIKMGMSGMDGTFDLYDDRQKYRGVANFGFDYNINEWNIYGKVQHFMETDTHTNFKTGITYSF